MLGKSKIYQYHSNWHESASGLFLIWQLQEVAFSFRHSVHASYNLTAMVEAKIAAFPAHWLKWVTSKYVLWALRECPNESTGQMLFCTEVKFAEHIIGSGQCRTDLDKIAAVT